MYSIGSIVPKTTATTFLITTATATTTTVVTKRNNMKMPERTKVCNGNVRNVKMCGNYIFKGADLSSTSFVGPFRCGEVGVSNFLRLCRAKLMKLRDASYTCYLAHKKKKKKIEKRMRCH